MLSCKIASVLGAKWIPRKAMAFLLNQGGSLEYGFELKSACDTEL
jgi:hypothetical protein